MAQLILWAMSTCRECRGVVTANTDNQLRTKTWPELVKWHGMLINRHWFNVTATRICHKAFPDTWRIDAVPWSENNTEAFAGLHNEGKRIFLGMDEASGIADPVWETSEGALTDAGTEIIWIAMGNPTRATGRFRECWTKHREAWTVRSIDASQVEGTNRALHERWARIYGENSQFYKIRVKGEFAEADVNQLISLAWVAEARMRGINTQSDGSLPKLRITADVSDGGEDDTVITVARHYQSFIHVLKQVKVNVSPSLAPIQTAEAVQRMWEAYRGDRNNGDDIVIDSLGVGAGTAGHLMKAQLPVIAYKGGEQAANPKQFRNKRVQSYIALRNALRDGTIALDQNMVADEKAWEEFCEQAASIRSKPGTEKLEDLITKEEMRRDGIKSPDTTDSLVMQFANKTPRLQIGSFAERRIPIITRSIAREGYIGGP
jgi:hypothetical protein